MNIKNPKGGSTVKAIVSVVVVAVFTVIAGPIAGYGVGCVIGLFCGSGSGGSTSYQQVAVNTPCTSAPNACNMTNIGSIVQTACTGDDGEPSRASEGPQALGGGSCGTCNATPPPDSACPAPAIESGPGFYANPAKVSSGGQSTLIWNAANATACSISGDNGFSYSGDTSGSVPTGALSQTTTFTLVCNNGDEGSSASASLRVILDPRYQEI